MSRIATTEATDTPTVTVLSAPRVDCPNSDCSSQNVLLVTCTAEERARTGGQGDQDGVESDDRRDGREDARRRDRGDRHGADRDVQTPRR